MDFDEIVFCETMFNNKIPAYLTKGVQGNKWLYLISGIHGDEMEGIFILKQLFDWMKTSFQNKLPVIVVPILNMDGYQAGTRLNTRSIDLNRNFPAAFKRSAKIPPPIGLQEKKREVEAKESTPLSEPETYYLKKLFDQYPPTFLINFKSGGKGKLISLGETAKKVGEFLMKFNQYELICDDHPPAGSLEAFVHDFYLAPVLSLKFPSSSKNKTYKELWNENSEGLFSLLNGQAF